MFEKWFGKKKVVTKKVGTVVKNKNKYVPPNIIIYTSNPNYGVHVIATPEGQEQLSIFMDVLTDIRPLHTVTDTSDEIAVYEPVGVVYRFKRIRVEKKEDTLQPTEGEHHVEGH